jgi:hypothetical protein
VDLTPADEKEVEAARVRLRKRMRAKLKLALSPIQKPGQGPARPRGVCNQIDPARGLRPGAY